MTYLRITGLVALLLSITACGGGGNNGGFFVGNNNTCNPGTQVQLARPQQGASNVGSINSIEIVANGNNRTMSTPCSWFKVGNAKA